MNEDENKPNPDMSYIVLPERRPMTLTEALWKIVQRLITLLIFLAATAVIVKLGWNGLTTVTHLPMISWREAFCAVVLIRTAGNTLAL